MESLFVDAEVRHRAPRDVSAALASIRADTVKQSINTHWYFDHTGGDQWLHKAEASIVAQQNTRKHLSEVTRPEGTAHGAMTGKPEGIGKWMRQQKPDRGLPSVTI